MTQDELIALARQVSNTPLDATSTPDLFGANQIVAFAKLVATKEREACAKVAESMSLTDANMNKTWRTGCRDVAESIRARGE